LRPSSSSSSSPPPPSSQKTPPRAPPKTVKQLLDEKCPLSISETRDGNIYINTGNGATRENYLFSGCNSLNSCNTINPDPISKNILDNISNTAQCGNFNLGDYEYTNATNATKWKLKSPLPIQIAAKAKVDAAQAEITRQQGIKRTEEGNKTTAQTAKNTAETNKNALPTTATEDQKRAAETAISNANTAISNAEAAIKLADIAITEANTAFNTADREKNEADQKAAGIIAADKAAKDKAAAELPAPSSILYDNNPYCQEWASLDFCLDDNYKNYMSFNCKKSCEENFNCPYWASAGYCTSEYSDYMSKNCKKACTPKK
jgi:hypothetical protein